MDIRLQSLHGNRAFLHVCALTRVSLSMISGNDRGLLKPLSGSQPLPGISFQKTGKGEDGSMMHA